MRISHNLMALSAQNNLNSITSKKAKSMEKLSSGYRINRSADDAAGLAISEKMRRLIRGLDQGTENALDGVSWTQIGDGALNEAHDILHRMTELTVKALNGTYTDSDRMYMEEEFEQLQSELDRISTTTTFNEIPIFDQHEIPYYQCEGGVKWDPQQMHIVTAGQNDLTFTYRTTQNDAPTALTITVPPGEYTTQELVDEIDDVFTALNMTEPSINLEFTQTGYCNANLEGGEQIDSVTGNLSYLLYDMYKGGGFGALIGTTSFPTENSKLKVVAGQNNSMSFTIEDFNGVSTNKDITIPEGSYTRSQMIDYLNAQLSDTTVKATAYGSGIKLSSDEAIVTGFKGNMFKIDGSGTIYNSVFYDNVKYGSVAQEPARFSGGYLLPTDLRDIEHAYYEINNTNNQLTVTSLNGVEKNVTLTIPEKNYTAQEMVDTLNGLFQDNSLDLTAEKITNGKDGQTFEGILIESKVEGPTSAIVLDATSSAYDTLFVTHEYNKYVEDATLHNEMDPDKAATFTGSKDLNIITPAAPLKVEAGKNDSFLLSLDGAPPYTIKLTEKTYNSVDEVVNELNTQLNGANASAGYKDMITATAVGGKIRLTSNPGKNIKTINVTADGTNGLDAVFQGYKIVTTQIPISGTGSVTLNTVYDGTIDTSESNMTITVDGIDYEVTLPTGSVSEDDVIKAIEEKIPDRTVTTENTFQTVNASGSTADRNIVSTAVSGKDNVTSWSGSDSGDSTEKEGVIEFETNEPATLTINVPLDNSMVVTSENNTITLKLNQTTKTITLDEGTYSQKSLQDALQKKIDAAFGTGMGGAIVGLSGGKLTLTSRLPDEENGKDTYIYCSTQDSTFLKELNTTRTPATCTSTRAMANAITIDNTNNVFSFTYKENGVTRNVNLNLTAGNYTQTGIANEINKQLASQGIGVKASASNGRLVLTSDAVGDGVSITYGTRNGGSSAEALFGPLTQSYPAKALVNLKTEDMIVIDGNSNEFVITVNSTEHTIILDEATYNNRSDFVDMLNSKLGSIGIQAYVEDGKLGYETTGTGNDANFRISYGGGGTSMKAIYGVSTTNYSGVNASFTGGKLTLETTNPNSSISVNSASGGAFQQPDVTSEPVGMSSSTGVYSTTKSYIDGANLNSPDPNGAVTIDQWNNTLKFDFVYDGTTTPVSVEVPDGTYTYAQLQTALQNLLNANTTIANKINVTVGDTGVRLEAASVGNKYQFRNFSGDFYDKVLCSCTEKTTTVTPTNKNGTQVVDLAYTVGRKDVRTQSVTIRRGISDELSLDLTYGNTPHKVQITLDPGEYTSEQLKAHLQDKINEQLVAMGLPENLIEVGVGGISTGVYGSNDRNALNFSLSKTIPAPGEGQFIIDGVSGSAAFEIFYQTDGKMEPAYIMGTKDISEGVTIKPGETDLTIKVDGVSYSITFPEGEYTAEELLETVNDKLDEAGAPLVAESDDGKLKLSYRKMGTHDIQEVSGSAKYTVFFSENGETEAEERYVQLSSQANDEIELRRHVFNTTSARINSICISKPKYAQKALERIKYALQEISNIRSDFGSTQNRLEHAINNNENKFENLQSAESVIRDTDMAKEMVANANYNILQQVGQAMLAQANQLPQSVLSLLQ